MYKTDDKLTPGCVKELMRREWRFDPKMFWLWQLEGLFDTSSGIVFLYHLDSSCIYLPLKNVKKQLCKGERSHGLFIAAAWVRPSLEGSRSAEKVAWQRYGGAVLSPLAISMSASCAELSQWNRAISACARNRQWVLSLQLDICS